LESIESIKFRGKKLTLSFYLKVGADFSAASSLLTARIVSGKGTDQKLSAFTTSANEISSDITATATSTLYSITTTSAIASDITQIGVAFSYDPVGTAGANDWFEITQVQLCSGDVALPYSPMTYNDEYRKCRRFLKVFGTAAGVYERFGTALAVGTTTADTSIFNYEPMRAKVSSVTYVGNLAVYSFPNAGLRPITSMSIDVGATSPDLTQIGIVCSGGGLTAGQHTSWFNNNDSTARVYLSAEI
jgi:hypothetical protein